MSAALFLSLLMAAQLSGDQADPEKIIVTEDPHVVEKCVSLGDVSGKSGWSRISGGGEADVEKGVARALESIRAQAAELGASVLLIRRARSLFVTSIGATAYRCS